MSGAALRRAGPASLLARPGRCADASGSTWSLGRFLPGSAPV